jgi:hypothetical protein
MKFESSVLIFGFCDLIFLIYLHPQQQGTLAEGLGTGLQNRLRRFDSARYLK